MTNTAAQETKVSSLAALRPSEQGINTLPTVEVGLTSLQGFELAQRAAKLLASSTLVPKEYQGNLSNCVIALNMASRVGADPLMVMQNLVIVHGKPTWSSQFLIATVNTCGRFTALRYEFFGEQGTDTWGCRAWAIEKKTGEKLVGTDITIAIAKKEGWYGKNGSKWQSIPQQMLMYRAASWWTRAYAPELSMGLHTQDEMVDVYDAKQDETGSYVVDTETLRSTMASAANDSVPEQATPSVTEAEVTEEETKPQTIDVGFDINAHNLKTQAGIREAVKSLCALLEGVPQDERGACFVANSGQQILSAASRAGLGTLRQRFVDLGISLPQE